VLDEARTFAADPTETHGLIWGIHRVDVESIRVIQDEAICRRAADLYANEGYAEPNTPVLVMSVGGRYLVDRLAPRAGSAVFWYVVVFDPVWNVTGAYGQGT
jgi:hypothetical protein